MIKTSTAILSKKNEPYRLYVRIEGGLPKAMNKVMRSHWAKNYKEADMWKKLIGNAVEHFLPPDVLEYAEISIIRHSHRMLDFDNCVSSFKPLIDGLKDLVIVDDSWRRTGAWRIRQEFRPKKLGPMVEIWIRESGQRDEH